jgi:IS4 transposase
MEVKGSVYFQETFARLLESNPVSLLARLAMERAFSAKALDALFETHRAQQYTRDLLFSSTVDLMGKVVLGKRSVRGAYLEGERGVRLGVSLQAVYDKLHGIEPEVCQALVAHSAAQAAEVVAGLQGAHRDLLQGWHLRLLDGNHIAATDRRLKPLRGSWAGPRPGFCLVVFDPATELVMHALPCEDAHAQERSLTAQVLTLVRPGECWVADRNFCTKTLLCGVVQAGAAFVVRHHANLEVRAQGLLRHCGDTETGEVWEQEVSLGDEPGALRLRRVVLKLKKATRDGDRQLEVLTTLPKEVSAVLVAETYRRRWRIETAFARLEKWLNAEIAPLGYPKAALFGFCVGLLAYNMLSTVWAALRAVHSPARLEDVSVTLLVDDLQGNQRGIATLLPQAEWKPLRALPLAAFVALLRRVAEHVRLQWYPKAKGGRKKPVTPRTKFVGTPHVATHRILTGECQESDS